MVTASFAVSARVVLPSIFSGAFFFTFFPINMLTTYQPADILLCMDATYAPMDN